MKKLLLVPVLFAIAGLLAGLYGVLHNQISYSVSPEYFHRFKFVDFGVLPEFHNRAGASVVGWYASWWMGILLGILLIPFGLTIPGTLQSFIGLLKAFVAVMVTALITGLAGLFLAFLFIDPSLAGEPVYNGMPIVDTVAFAQAGVMHNMSYLGGLLGLVVGAAVIVAEKQNASTLAPTRHSQRTRHYRVYHHRVLGMKVVKCGFSWPAFFFGYLWMAYTRLWGKFGLWLTIFLITYGADLIAQELILDLGLGASGLHVLISLLFIGLYFLQGLIPGLRGHQWQESALLNRGFERLGLYKAASPRQAIAQSLDDQRAPLT